MMIVRQAATARSVKAGRGIPLGARTLAAPRKHMRGAVAVAAAVPTSTLGSKANALEFSRVMNGCWQLAGGHGTAVFEGIQDTLDAHADAGFTTFDTADIYGPSEQILGEFLKQRRAAGKPGVQVFTKYVPNIFQGGAPKPAAVEAAVKRSLGALGVDSLDLVQMHWWDYGVPGMVDTAKALADCQAKGLIKHIGTTNLNVEALQALVAAEVPVACSQVQFSLLDRRPLNGMLDFCQNNNIKVFSYGSVAGGLLSDRYVEEPKKGLFGSTKYSNVDLNTSSLKMYWNVAKRFGGQELWRKLLQVLDGVSKKHGVSVSNVALRWVMQQGDGQTVCPIVGVRGASHIADNARVFDFALDAEDLEAIDKVLAEAQGPNGDCYSFERGG